MWFDLGFLSLGTGLLCLDRRAIGQTMLSQPAVAVPLLGLWFGQLEFCLMMGAILQLFWMSANLYGANVPQNDTLSSLSAVGAFLIVQKVEPNIQPSLWVIAVMVTMPFAYLGRRLQGALDRFNTRYSIAATKKVDGAVPVSVFKYVAASMIAIWVSHSLLTMLSSLICFGALYFLHDHLTADALSATDLMAWFILPALALSVSLELIRKRIHLAISVLSFVVLGAIFQSMGLIL